MSHTDQFNEICSLPVLMAAWARVEESDGCAGIDGVTLARFARRTFIAQFEARINTVVPHPRARFNTTWSGCIDIR